jgi:hypothetical protein
LVAEEGVLAEDAGVEGAAGAVEEPSDPELAFVPPSSDEADDESLLPSLEPAPLSFDALPLVPALPVGLAL